MALPEVGEELDDLNVFDPEEYINSLLGLEDA
jgi:signal recognition particle GTPase